MSKPRPAKPPAPPSVLKKIEALLARAADPGASEAEQRTSAVIAAKLMREHGIVLGGPAAPPPATPDGFRLLDRLLASASDPRVRAVVDDPRTRAVLSDLADRVLDSLLKPSRRR